MERIPLAELFEIEQLEKEAYREANGNLFALVSDTDKREEDEDENEAFMEFDSYNSMGEDEEDNDYIARYYE